MKVVLFCGGLGMRLQGHAESVPKPMVRVGYRPILWHVMKYYAHYGHKDFILCLGYKADVIKNYFLNYNECISNDFVMSNGGQTLHLLNSDIHDWNITFVDTGLYANIGERFVAVERYLDGESVFLANYADGVTDLDLPAMIDDFLASDRIASFLSVKPPQSFHIVRAADDSTVRDIQPVTETDIRINGGYFVFRPDIFDYIEDGEELILEPFQRLIAENKLACYPHDGFWACMDTFKEKQFLEDMHMQERAPWEVWDHSNGHALNSSYQRNLATA